MERIGVFLLLACCFLQVASNNMYGAVVVEYTRRPTTDENVHTYVEYISNARKKWPDADIIVFPEGGVVGNDRKRFQVPKSSENIIPCENSSYATDDAMYKLSKAAKENRMYVVVNLLEVKECIEDENGCPKTVNLTFNTNVVFDRAGKVIARYRKYNLFDEVLTNRPTSAELVTFETDFGVTFGMFTCFDILFKTPTIDLVKEKNISHLIFPTHWFGELPFLTATQMQTGWSFAMDAYLLASGVNKPKTGSTGSGFYFQRKGFYSYMTSLEEDAMIYAELPKVGTPSAVPQTDVLTIPSGVKLEENNKLILLEDPSMRRAIKEELKLNETKFVKRICSNAICCEFDLRYKNTKKGEDKYKYMAIVYEGIRPFGLTTVDFVEYCAVVLCKDHTCGSQPQDGEYPLSFNTIDIQATVPAESSFQMPDTLVWSSEPNFNLMAMKYDEFEYTTSDSNGTIQISMKLKKADMDKLITFGFFGRNFRSSGTRPQFGITIFLSLLYSVRNYIYGT